MKRAILRVVVRGRVQGVGYRAWVEHRAKASGLEGWVRNRRDGSVEAVFAGPPEALDDMVALCRRGPPAAQVEAVLNESAAPEQLGLRRNGDVFSVLPRSEIGAAHRRNLAMASLNW